VDAERYVDEARTKREVFHNYDEIRSVLDRTGGEQQQGRGGCWQHAHVPKLPPLNSASSCAVSPASGAVLGVEPGQLMGKRECLRFLMFLHQCENGAEDPASPAGSLASMQTDFTSRPNSSGTATPAAAVSHEFDALMHRMYSAAVSACRLESPSHTGCRGDAFPNHRGTTFSAKVCTTVGAEVR